MKQAILILAAVVLTGSAPEAVAADLTGKVTLRGTPPAEFPIDFSDHPDVAALHPTVTTTRRYVVGKDAGLKDVFVYISKGMEGKTFPVPTEPVELDIVNAAFEPYVLGLMVGQKLNINNKDPISNNVHATPAVPSNQEFNNMLVQQGDSASVTFSKPEVLVRLRSEVHDWMFAYVGVVDNPYFAVTDADGHFKISNVPPGNYTLTAFHLAAHRATGGISQEIKVAGEASVAADFTVEVPK